MTFEILNYKSREFMYFYLGFYWLLVLIVEMKNKGSNSLDVGLKRLQVSKDVLKILFGSSSNDKCLTKLTLNFTLFWRK